MYNHFREGLGRFKSLCPWNGPSFKTLLSQGTPCVCWRKVLFAGLGFYPVGMVTATLSWGHHSCHSCHSLQPETGLCVYKAHCCMEG